MKLLYCTARSLPAMQREMRVQPLDSGSGLCEQKLRMTQVSTTLMRIQATNSSFHGRKAVAPLKQRLTNQRDLHLAPVSTVERPWLH